MLFVIINSENYYLANNFSILTSQDWDANVHRIRIKKSVWDLEAWDQKLVFFMSYCWAISANMLSHPIRLFVSTELYDTEAYRHFMVIAKCLCMWPI